MSTRNTRPTLLHRAEYLAFRGVETLLSGASMESCVTVGRLLGRLYHVISPKYRRLVRRNLRIATAGDAPSAETLDALVLETFQRTGANFIASLRTPTMSLDAMRRHVTEEGLHELGGCVRRGSGLVVAMAHMGNWEAMTSLGASFVHEGVYGGVYRPLDNPLMDRLTRERRTKDGALLFSREDGFHAPAAMLKTPGALGVLADQRAGGRGIAMPFLGKMTTCSPLPDLLARRGRARVCTLSISTIGQAQWRMELRELEGPINTRSVMAGLEKAIRLSLPDVFWFHNRWRTDPARPLSFFTKIDPAVAAEATVPLRLILTTPAHADELGIRQMLLRMLEKRPDLRIDRLCTTPTETIDPRIVHHEWDPTLPPEQADGFLDKIDRTHPAPLDGSLLFAGEVGLARAAKRAGLRAIIGLGVSGKPWTRSFETPASTEDWLELAELMARVPQRHRS
ncbi:lipid A biosynthesis lauroylacyl transferase [Haloferula helveola]|uniref:Lipid A biosynthesis lauroylacyl transferase n=1 Tax=Haloferula helveola TaxID=490095 RepID=A0ABM7RQY1_9BACT|nr:lipid A biosynthesis lauroylacyl transferase [Haloferula helveola]